MWDEHILLCTIAIGNNIVSLYCEIYPGVSSQLVPRGSVYSCPISIYAFEEMSLICQCHSFCGIGGGFVRFSLIIWTNWLFFSCLCTVIWLCTTYHMNPSYSLPPQHGWVFSGREDVCAPPASAEFHAHGKPTLRLFVEVKEWCINDCPNKYQRHSLNSCILIIRVYVYIDLIICQARISFNRKLGHGTVK